MNQPTVYILRDLAGEAIYVGCSINPVARLMAHAGRSWWSDVAHVVLEHHASQEAALRREAQLIAELAPRENRRPGTQRSEDELREQREAGKARREARRSDRDDHHALATRVSKAEDPQQETTAPCPDCHATGRACA